METNLRTKFLLVILLITQFSISFSQALKSPVPFDFKGKMLISVSDADMVASAYSDGKLGTPDGSDALSIIKLDKPIRDLKAEEIGVSNSVTGPAISVAVTPNGRYAIVIETRGSLPKGKSDVRLKDLEVGKMITVIDLINPDKPTISQKIDGIEGFKNPQAVSINAKGNLVAISFNPEKPANQSPLVIYKFDEGKLSNPTTPVIPEWNLPDKLIVAEFHPTENLLCLLNLTKATVSFVTVEQKADSIQLMAWGNKVEMDKEPFKATFTPNGKFVLVNSLIMYGTVSVIKLGNLIDKNDTLKNELVSKATTSIYPEGLAISPDGNWVVTTNLEMSWSALDDPKQGFFSSISLLSFNQETGFLKHLRDFTFDGILPEAAVFDNSSNFLAVTNFDHFDRSKSGGSIDFWRLSKDINDPTRVEMVKTNYSVPVTRGVHSLVIVR